MTSRYCRLYWRFADEYPEVWDDDATNALWHRLLRIGDMAWPADGVLPYGTKRRALATLEQQGLVSLHGGGRFRIRGMDKERAARRDQASKAAYASHAQSSAESSAESSAQSLPIRVEQSRAEESRAEQGAEADAFETYQRLTMRVAKGGAAQWIGRLIDKYDEALVERAIVHAHGQDSDPSSLLGRVEGLLDQRAFRESKQREQRAKDRAIREQEEHRARVENATPEELAKIERNKAAIRAMVRGIASGSDDGRHEGPDGAQQPQARADHPAEHRAEDGA